MFSYANTNTSNFQITGIAVDGNVSENKDKTPATLTVEEQQAARDAALHELETGQAPAANGLPHQGGDNGAAGDNGGHYTGLSSSSSETSSSSSLDTEEIVAFAVDSDEDGGGGQDDSAGERASSISLAAYFVSSAGDMMREHERARKNADMYMAEVTYARGKLPFPICVVLSETSSSSRRVWSGSTALAGPCARPRRWPGPRRLSWPHSGRRTMSSGQGQRRQSRRRRLPPVAVPS